MFIASHGGELAALNEILSRLASFAVDGVIAFLPLGDRSAIVNHASHGLRIVVVDLPTTGRNIGSVTSELARGAELAVAHLVERGRRSIVMIANQDSLLSAHPPRRESGLRHGLHVAGLPHREEALFRVLPTVEGGRVAMEALLDRCPDLDAVFTYNDFMAIGALQALVSAGRRVPDDVALVGFDDIAICSALVPALTSVRLDRARIGREAVAILDRLAEQTDGPGPAVTVEVELIVRESS